MNHPTIDARNWLTESAVWLYGEDTNFDDSDYSTDISKDVTHSLSPIIRTEYFTPDGMKLQTPRRGLNIIRHIRQDGTTTVDKVIL